MKCSTPLTQTPKVNHMLLDGRKVALITGAGSGIGRALTIEAINRGYHIVAVGRRLQPLQETAVIAGKPAQIHLLSVDVTSAKGRLYLVKEITETYGHLNILINNAGTLNVGHFKDLSDDDMQNMVSLNLVAPALMARDCLPLLKQAGGASIVNVGSVFGDIAYPYFAGYSATKFGLRGLSDALRRELRKDDINVTYLAPRAAKTDATSKYEKLVGPMEMKLDQPDVIAKQSWDAIEAKKHECHPWGLERLFIKIQRWFPKLIDQNIIKQAQSKPVLAALEK